jgi:putative ABC transport system permease protein
MRASSVAEVAAVKAAIWSVNGSQPITDIVSVGEAVRRATAARRFNMLVMSVFGLLALAIASTGVYAVMAFAVTQRTREIGIRIALGARAGQVVGLFLRQGILLILAGLASGVLAAWWLAASIESYLFEVQPRDPRVFVAATVALGFVAFAACWWPARRASRVDPTVALRAE